MSITVGFMIEFVGFVAFIGLIGFQHLPYGVKDLLTTGNFKYNKF